MQRNVYVIGKMMTFIFKIWISLF